MNIFGCVIARVVGSGFNVHLTHYGWCIHITVNVHSCYPQTQAPTTWPVSSYPEQPFKQQVSEGSKSGTQFKIYLRSSAIRRLSFVYSPMNCSCCPLSYIVTIWWTAHAARLVMNCPSTSHHLMNCSYCPFGGELFMLPTGLVMNCWHVVHWLIISDELLMLPTGFVMNCLCCPLGVASFPGPYPASHHLQYTASDRKLGESLGTRLYLVMNCSCCPLA